MKKNTTTILIFLIILISTILIGNPLVKNENLINIIIGISGIYIILKSFKDKQKIITNKTTKIMLMLLIISALPLLLNTYISLNGTINYIFRYISVFIIYILINQELKESRDNLGKIKDIIIISGIILVAFGIDLLTTNITYDFVKKIIGVTTDQSALTRIYSLFLYNNVFAISTVVAYLISIEQMLNKKEKIYAGLSTALVFGIILSQSRTTLLILALIIILYLIILSKEKRYDYIKLIFVNFGFGIIYATIFTYLKRIGYIHLIWFITLILPVIATFAYNKLESNKPINKVFKVKYLITLCILFIVLVLILSLFKSELILFNNNNSQSIITKNIYDVKEKNQYKIELEIESKSETLEDNYTIEFIQRNNYADNIGKEKIEVNNYEGIKEVNINTSEGIKWIELRVSAQETGNGNELKIKSLKINGKQFTLNYKFLPTDLISQLKYLDLSQRSVQERKVFVIDAFKIIKSNNIFGIGGDGYKYAVQDVQSYNYSVTQMHCYILQIAMEFGILGLIAFGYLIVLTIKNILYIIKNKEEEKYGIILAFMALFLHSLLDFDMTFLYIMLIFYSLISIINFNENEENNTSKNKVTEIIILILAVISLIFNINELYVSSTKDEAIRHTRTYEEKTRLEKQYIYLVPYSENYTKERIAYIKLYKEVKADELSEESIKEMQNELVQLLKTKINHEKNNSDIISECVEIINNSNNKEDKEFAYKKIEERLQKHRYNAEQIMSDYEQLIKLNNDKVQEIIDRNIDNSIKNIQDYNKCRITKEQSQKIIEKIKFSEKRILN